MRAYEQMVSPIRHSEPARRVASVACPGGPLAGVDAKWRLHDLLDWSASAALAAGHDGKTVAYRPGHTNTALTLRVFAHAFANSDRAVADSVRAMLEVEE